MESVPDATPHNQNRESPHAAQRIGKHTQKASDQSFRTAENTCRNAGKYPKTIYHRIRPPSGMSSVFSLAFSSGASKKHVFIVIFL